jgi:hypothetical protein
MNSQDKTGLEQNKSRKTYSSPVLQVYGNIRTLTNSAGMITMLDGMATGNTKTN